VCVCVRVCVHVYEREVDQAEHEASKIMNAWTSMSTPSYVSIMIQFLCAGVCLSVCM
jgi:hypothetical protein